jgi:hypothetical protein
LAAPVLPSRLTAALALTASFGCAEAPSLLSAEEAPALGGERHHGLVVLTHEYNEPGVAVSGQLMRWRGTSRAAALHALAVPEQAFLAATPPAPGTCRALVLGDEPAPESVDLLAVGPMTVRPPARQAMELSPRDFPAVTFRLSGVVYDADAPEQLDFVAGGDYTVSAPGDELGAVTGRVEAPPPVWLQQVTVDDEGVQVRWGGPADATVLLWRDVGALTVGVACRGEGGSATVDAAELTRLGGSDLQLVVAQVRRAPLQVDGVDDATLIFVSRDTAELDLSPSHQP